MAKSTVKKPNGGARSKTFKETRRDAKKSRGALKKRVASKLSKLLGL